MTENRLASTTHRDSNQPQEMRRISLDQQCPTANTQTHTRYTRVRVCIHEFLTGLLFQWSRSWLVFNHGTSVQIGYIMPWSFQMRHLGVWDKQKLIQTTHNTLFNLVFLQKIYSTHWWSHQRSLSSQSLGNY